MKPQKSLLRWILLGSMTVVSGLAQAQYFVSGNVADATDGESLPTTIYHIYNEADTLRPVINDIVGDDASFRRQLPSAGSYYIDFEYIGYAPLRKHFKVSAEAPVADLGKVSMTLSDTMLEEVTVTAKKALVVSDGANLEYNVKEDPSSQSSSVLEMLRKVPMVTVDGEDNIRVNGSSDFRIYLNGRPNPMFNNDPQKVLKAMPANAISRIEVLTEPGAKYDAEGIGGILNIVIESGSQDATDGYAGNVNLSVSSQNISGSAYMRAKKDKVTASVTGAYADSRMYTYSGKSSVITDYHDNPLYVKQIMDGDTHKNNSFYFGQANVDLSWEPNVSNLFTLNANFHKVSGCQESTYISKMLGHTATPIWHHSTDLDAVMSRLGLTVNLSYQHQFKRQDNTLSAALQYDRGNNSMDISQLQKDLNGTGAAPLAMYSNDYTQNNEYTLQVDYHNQLTDKHLIETGAKGVISDNNNKSKQLIGESFGNLTDDPDNRVRMNQFRDIAALYASYTGVYGNWRATAGLRYEYTHMGVNFHTPGYEDFSSDLHDAVPNASLTYSLSPTSNLRAAYNMRISRPSISQLNPFRMEISGNNVRTGNPDLDSQTSNNISLAFSSFSGKMSYNIKAEYQLINNMIGEYSYLDGDEQYQTYLNLGRMQKAILSGFVNCYLSQRMSATLSAGVEYTDVRVKKMDLSNSGWTFNANLNWNYTLPADIKLAVYGGLSTRSYIFLQGHYAGWHYYGLGINRSFLKDKSLTIGLSCANIFEKYTSWKGIIRTKEFTQRSEGKMQSWNVGLNISWSFGSLKQDVKKIKTTIENNDAPDTKGGNGTGGGIL